MKDTVEALDLDTGQHILISADTVLGTLVPVEGKALVPAQTTALVYAPEPPLVQPGLRQLFRDCWVDGHGIVYTVVAGWTGLAVVTASVIYADPAIIGMLGLVMDLVHMVAAAVSIILGIAAAILLYVLLFGRAATGSITLKGCAHGGSPGSHNVHIGPGGRMFYKGK